VLGSFNVRSGEISIARPVTSSTATAVIDAASFPTGSAVRASYGRRPKVT